MSTLNILGASYGLNDVTSLVRTKIQNDTLTVIADAPTLGDAMPATAKSLVVVYQYDNGAPRVAITQTDQTLTITDDHTVTPWSPAPAGQLTVLGAAYGLADVTAQVRGFIQNNQLNLLAANGMFNIDPWPMVLKTLVVVYAYNGVPTVKIVQENTQLEIAPLANKPLFILGAAYGPSNVTVRIAAKVDAFEELHVAVDAAALGDPWPGNSKSLSVVYQYEGERPQLAIAPDGGQLDIVYTPQPAYQPSTDASQLQILGASYGLVDVTGQVTSKIQNDQLQVLAANGVLNIDGWPLVVKTLAVFYRYGTGAVGVAWCKEDETLTIQPEVEYALQLNNNGYVAGALTYNFGQADLTIEMWVQTQGPGPLLTFRRGSATGLSPLQESLTFIVQANGSLQAAVCGFKFDGTPLPGPSAVSAPTPILDADWHHVALVRSGTTISFFVDGDPLNATVTNLAGTVCDLSTSGYLYLGLSLPAPAGLLLGPFNFTGSLDEVRFWSRALSPAEIRDNVHHQLTDQEAGLVAHWTFNAQNLLDSSPSGMHLSPFNNGVAFVPAELDIEPEGQPYIVTQAQLMQDYVPDPDHAGEFLEISGYRVIISARDDAGNASPCTITLWAADPDVPAQLHFFDGTQTTVTDTTGFTRSTNMHGELSFVINSDTAANQANDNPLVCPVLKVNASFMAPTHRVIISPDRHVHATLAALTGAQLAGTAPLPSGKQAPLKAGLPTTNYDAIAQAISHTMSAASEHSVQSDRPLTRKRNDPLDQPLNQPVTPLYENVMMIAAPYDFGSNAVSTHFLETDQQVARVLVPENMANAHWSYDHQAAAFAPLTLDARNTVINNLTITHLDSFTRLFNSQATPILSMDALLSAAQTEVTANARQKRWFGGDFLDIVGDAAKIVMTTVETRVSSVAGTIKTLVVTAVDAAGRAFDAALETVEDAVQFAVALLKKVGALVSDIVTFVKELFNWSDIISTQLGLEAALNQMPTLLKGTLDAAQGKVDAGLDTIKATIQTEFTTWISALSGQTFNNQTKPAKNNAPSNIQSRYITSLYSDNVTSATSSDNATFVIDTGLNTTLSTAWDSQFPASNFDGLHAQVANSGIAAHLVDTGSAFDRSVQDILVLLKDALVGLIDLVKGGIDALFGVIKLAIDEIFKLCNTRINIPFVTSFYEKVVTQGRDTLTLLSLISLCAAVPLTVAYKLAHGQTSVFSPDDLQNLSNPSWSGYADLLKPIQSLFGSSGATRNTLVSRSTSGEASSGEASALDRLKQILGWGMNFVYAFSSMFWGIMCAIEDGLTSVAAPTLQFIVVGKIVSQLIALISCFPAWTLPGNANAWYIACTIAIYMGGIVAFFSNVVAANPLNQLWSKIEDPLLTGLYGVAQLVGYAFILAKGEHLSWATPVTILLDLAEAFEWFPQLGKLPLVNQFLPSLKLAIPFIDIAAYWLVFYETIFLTFMSIGGFRTQ